MAIDIYASLHSRTDVRLSKISTALLLARRASPDGVVRISYSYLAMLLKCCRRTAIRHIKALIEDAEILIKEPVKWLGPKRCAINVYRFCLKFRRISAHPFSGDTFAKMSSTPRNPEEERKEDLRSLREKIEKIKRGMRFKTPGSALHQLDEDELQRLEAQAARLAAAPSPEDA
jgi:hypothetical protein